MHECSPPKNLELLSSKLPKAARETHQAPGLINNLLSVSILYYASCGVWFHNKCCGIGFNDELMIRSWRNTESNMWRVSLRYDRGSIVIPSDDCNITSGAMPSPKFPGNKIYKCDHTTQLIKLYHTTLGYPAVSTW